MFKILKLLIFYLVLTGKCQQSLVVTNSNLCFCTKSETPLCQTVKKFNVHNGDTFEANCNEAVKINTYFVNGSLSFHVWLLKKKIDRSQLMKMILGKMIVKEQRYIISINHTKLSDLVKKQR